MELLVPVCRRSFIASACAKPFAELVNSTIALRPWTSLPSHDQLFTSATSTPLACLRICAGECAARRRAAVLDHTLREHNELHISEDGDTTPCHW